MEPCRSGKPQGPDGRRFGVTAAVRSPTSMALAATRTLGRGFFHYLHAEVRRTLSKASKGKRIHRCACRHWRLWEGSLIASAARVKNNGARFRRANAFFEGIAK